MKKLLVILIGLFMTMTLSGCAGPLMVVAKDLPKERAAVVEVETYQDVDQKSLDKFLQTKKHDDVVFLEPKGVNPEMKSLMEKTLKEQMAKRGFVIADPNNLPPSYIKVNIKLVVRPATLFTNGGVLVLVSVYDPSGRTLLQMDLGALTDTIFTRDASVIGNKFPPYIADRLAEKFL